VCAGQPLREFVDVRHGLLMTLLDHPDAPALHLVLAPLSHTDSPLDHSLAWPLFELLKGNV
jgi:hypothetical protein